MIVIDDAAEMTKEMWAYLDTVVKGKVMDNEKEIVWTDDMGFMPPVRRTEGRTICRYECQLTEYKAEIEQLRKVLQQITELSPFKFNTGHASLQYITQMLVEMTALAHEALKEKV
jgi:hypothetical protein